MDLPATPQTAERLQQLQAYTTTRPDVCALVPKGARRVLDVGCSNGALGLSLMHDRPGCLVDGIELDEEMARQAAQRLSHVTHTDLDRLDWTRWNAEARYDCIVFADVLEHLADPARHLIAARSRLTRDGCVVLSLPNVRHLSALVAIFVRGRFPRRARGLFDRTHLRWFTLCDAEALLADCGYAPDDRILSLRWGDQGGGRANRWLNRLPLGMREWAPVREFLTYQVSLRARPHPS